MRYFANAILALSFFASAGHCADTTDTSPIEIKAVVVAMFEIGEDEGDKPGEFQLWKKGQKLSTRYALPHAHHDIMDPADGTIGSAVWTDYVVDGDLAHQIDAREIPGDWKTGYFPLFTHSPYANAASVNPEKAPNGEVYILNASLRDWAFNLTKDTALPNTPAMDKLRATYTGFPNALTAPTVMTGSHLSASTFWHGKLLNDWANDWVGYWTQSKGNFMTSGMEDSATLQALTYLDNANLVDKDRVLILRTASNFTMQPAGLTAAKNLELESSGEGYAALQSAVEAAYAVGSVVIEEITTNWDTVKNELPVKQQ